MNHVFETVGFVTSLSAVFVLIPAGIIKILEWTSVGRVTEEVLVKYIIEQEPRMSDKALLEIRDYFDVILDGREAKRSTSCQKK